MIKAVYNVSKSYTNSVLNAFDLLDQINIIRQKEGLTSYLSYNRNDILKWYSSILYKEKKEYCIRDVLLKNRIYDSLKQEKDPKRIGFILLSETNQKYFKDIDKEYNEYILNWKSIHFHVKEEEKIKYKRLQKQEELQNINSKTLLSTYVGKTNKNLIFPLQWENFHKKRSSVLFSLINKFFMIMIFLWMCLGIMHLTSNLNHKNHKITMIPITNKECFVYFLFEDLYNNNNQSNTYNKYQCLIYHCTK